MQMSLYWPAAISESRAPSRCFRLPGRSARVSPVSVWRSPAPTAWTPCPLGAPYCGLSCGEKFRGAWGDGTAFLSQWIALHLINTSSCETPQWKKKIPIKKKSYSPLPSFKPTSQSGLFSFISFSPRELALSASLTPLIQMCTEADAPCRRIVWIFISARLLLDGNSCCNHEYVEESSATDSYWLVQHEICIKDVQLQVFPTTRMNERITLLYKQQ